MLLPLHPRLLDDSKKSSLKEITYQQVVQERRSIKRYTVKDYNKVRDSERRY